MSIAHQVQKTDGFKKILSSGQAVPGLYSTGFTFCTFSAVRDQGVHFLLTGVVALIIFIHPQHTNIEPKYETIGLQGSRMFL